jgi:hypothetical protein
MKLVAERTEYFGGNNSNLKINICVCGVFSRVETNERDLVTEIK